MLVLLHVRLAWAGLVCVIVLLGLMCMPGAVGTVLQDSDGLSVMGCTYNGSGNGKHSYEPGTAQSPVVRMAATVCCRDSCPPEATEIAVCIAPGYFGRTIWSRGPFTKPVFGLQFFAR